MLGKAIQLYHTIKYLKVKQVVWRFIYFLPRFVSPESKCPETKSVAFFSIPKTGLTEDYDSYKFLNEVHQISRIGWDNSSISKLWKYNLHYFDFLNQFELRNEGVEIQNNTINKWIIENPYGKGTGWEPYPTSLRIINWIKWHFKTKRLSDEAKLSLWNQVQWLAVRPEYHLLGNHLFINAKALLFASTFFGLDENSVLSRKALKILKVELGEQFLEDGAHFELSPMYHALAMEDLLDLYQLTPYLPSIFPSQQILNRYFQGMKWLALMKYENDELAHFNDCANGVAPTFKELEELGVRLGLKQSFGSNKNFRHFKQSGFAVFKNENIHIIADIGNIGPDYLPGHAHADSLSFELAIKGQRVIVNSGTSEYGLSHERFRQRSTSAHSTVELDKESSSEVWSGFRVARRARITEVKINEENDKLEFAAVHDGYKRIASKPLHKRKWKLYEGNLEIIDEVKGSGNNVQLRYYLHPDIQIELLDDEIVLSSSEEYLAKIRTDRNVEVMESTYHDNFGSSKKNNYLLITGTTPFFCKVIISFI
uniref:heparinase II/III domain-containing protein n=1 Tax=Algoriphagus sp. TaxID=1872435 RepID=UPI00404865A3